MTRPIKGYPPDLPALADLYAVAWRDDDGHLHERFWRDRDTAEERAARLDADGHDVWLYQALVRQWRSMSTRRRKSSGPRTCPITGCIHLTKDGGVCHAHNPQQAQAIRPRDR